MDSESLTQDLAKQLNMKEEIIEDETEDYVDEEDEEEFSFACGIDAPPIAADEVFYNGQIRPLFPLFNQNLILSDQDLEALKEQLPLKPPVKKIFIQTEDNSTGPFCEWSKNNKAIEATPDSLEVCKKSNSTGFSKLWRFKDFLHRSNSDGRDTFVFLNPTLKVEEKDNISSQVKKSSKGVKKSEGLLAHEAYMKSKAKTEHRRRSYLPYRPEVVGFFTNANGGLTRNVHPF
ncbi:hypothetical protein K7X08_006363 [Anisodus acutangulus]|uniref:Uncharacterized protein n=1 Tax=Anisodus acutangulus TaxID=402998 RepID=A0A9Q1RRD0_9SOLA|nr:hypothetical protein K7X08_006363 [Anisodus acutangulus]